MELQQRRVAVFFAATFLGLTMFVNLCIDRFAFAWYNLLQGMMLFPCIVSAVLLLRLWIKQAKRRRDAAAYKKRLRISGQL